MLIYNELKNKPREFLAATGLKLAEFEKLLPAFQTAYEKKYPPHLTQAGKTRQRQIGGGATGALPKSEDKLFFILVYQKTTPLQTMHGLQFGLSQPQAKRAWRCWGKPRKSTRMTRTLHLPHEPGEALLCASHCNSSSVTMTVRKKPSPMSSPSTSTTSASNISGEAWPSPNNSSASSSD